ncbi:MAG: hypothetical protein ACPGXL_09025 [Chitinophagales bacterium]
MYQLFCSHLVWICMVSICFGASPTLFAQITNPSTYDLQFANPIRDCSSDTTRFCIDIQIKAADNAPDFAVGSYTLFFTYNKNALSNSAYEFQAFSSSTLCEITPTITYPPFSSTGDAAIFSEIGIHGEGSISAHLNDYIAGLECPVVSQNWRTMGQLCFDVVDSEEPVNLTFNTLPTLGDIYTLINQSDNTPQHNAGTWKDYNLPTFDCDKRPICLPVQLEVN